MSRRLLFVLAAFTMASVLAPVVAVADDGGRPFATGLTGAAELPGPGDPDAVGSATLSLNQGQGTVCFSIRWEDIDGTVTASHIHVGTVTEFGAVVVPLFVNATLPGTGETSGCTTGVDPGLLKAIRQNPSGYYVNVHSSSFLPGAIRGQLGK
ncbi:MAG TPA: CHRD domain-containing protein [Actinomycetota bacterium]|nr:CHRD domain-containing protein [Actinomycetota bacterium]